MSPGNPLIFLDQTVKGQGHDSQKTQCRRGFRNSCECWLFLVNVYNHPRRHRPVIVRRTRLSTVVT